MTSIFEGQPSKRGPFPIKTWVIWVLGTYTLPETNSSPLEPKASQTETSSNHWFSGWAVSSSEGNILKSE